MEIKVALIGGMRSGKSTIADAIADKDIEGIRKISFGDGIRDIADKYFEYMYEQVYEGEYPFETWTIIKPRHILQSVGQLLREIDEDVWIKQVEKRIEYVKTYTSYKGVVIDDLRQPNEYNWAKDNGFIIIKVDTPDKIRYRRMKELHESVDDTLTHETESYYEDFEYDYIIDGSLPKLEMWKVIDDMYNDGAFIARDIDA